MVAVAAADREFFRRNSSQVMTGFRELCPPGVSTKLEFVLVVRPDAVDRRALHAFTSAWCAPG
jgi:hypothetical protein